MERGGLREALLRNGWNESSAVFFWDEMRIGLRGQIRRVWAPIGDKVRQKMEIGYAWAYLILTLDVRKGEMGWKWLQSMKKRYFLGALSPWKEKSGVIVWDGAGSHRAKEIKGMGIKIVFLPPYSPELDPVERIFEEIRREVEGKIYGELEKKKEAVEVVLREMAKNPEKVKRLTQWEWILQNLKPSHP